MMCSVAPAPRSHTLTAWSPVNGAALPPRDPAMGDALQLVSGLGDDADARVLVLNDSEYLYDDQVGEGHEDASVTAELKLRRDVRDFLVRAHAEKWP